MFLYGEKKHLTSEKLKAYTKSLFLKKDGFLTAAELICSFL